MKVFEDAVPPKEQVENALKAQGAKGVLTRCVAIFLNDGDIIRLEANSWEELLAGAGGTANETR